MHGVADDPLDRRPRGPDDPGSRLRKKSACGARRQVSGRSSLAASSRRRFCAALAMTGQWGDARHWDGTWPARNGGGCATLYGRACATPASRPTHDRVRRRDCHATSPPPREPMVQTLGPARRHCRRRHARLGEELVFNQCRDRDVFQASPRPRSCRRSKSAASDPRRTRGINEAAERPDSEILRHDARKPPLPGVRPAFREWFYNHGDRHSRLTSSELVAEGPSAARHHRAVSGGGGPGSPPNLPRLRPGAPR